MILFHLYQYYSQTSSDIYFAEIADLCNLPCKGDNLDQFMCDWMMMLSQMRNLPTKEQLESLLREKVRHVTHFKMRFDSYMNKCSESKQYCYDDLYNLFMRYLDEQRAYKNHVNLDHRKQPVLSGASKRDKNQPKGSCDAYWRNGKCSK